MTFASHPILRIKYEYLNNKYHFVPVVDERASPATTSASTMALPNEEASASSPSNYGTKQHEAP